MRATGIGAASSRGNLLSIGLFVLMAYGLGWAAFVGFRAAGLPFVVTGNAGMLAPAIAVLVLVALRRARFSDLGLWPLGRIRWYVAPYVLIPLLIAAGAALELVTRYQHWDVHLDPLQAAGIPVSASTLPMPTSTLLLLLAVSALTEGALVGLPFTLGEELGWRGFLAPRLTPLGGTAAAVVTGVIWGLWHLPVIGLSGWGAVTSLPGYEPTSWYAALFFCLTTVPLSIIYVWLRFRSGSVWPCVLAHAMANSGFALLAILVLSRPGSPLIGGPVGLLGVAPLWLVAVWIVLRGGLRVGTSTTEANEAGGHRYGVAGA
ncbi:MAG: CPBP family intramembrane metalloprotease [Actinobacteria bacterium]|nr:CPBP family intramembrane metalloprotease [Actinomycetota bacterium]